MRNKKAFISATFGAMLLLTASMPPMDYKKGMSLPSDPAQLRRALERAGARYLDTQDGIVYLSDKYGGMPCTLQYMLDKQQGPAELFATFRVQDNWKALTKDYDKLQDYMVKQYGKPTQERYSFLNAGIKYTIDEMNELREGYCDWMSIWDLPDGQAVLKLDSSATGECFALIIWKIQ